MGLTRDIDVHIDTLVIDGVSQADGVMAGAALSDELVQLLTASPGPAGLSRDRAVDRLDAGTLAVRTTTRPATLGRAVAQAVHRRLIP